MPEPLVSVVVPTHNRPARLARLIAALRDQTLAEDRFEVIVVADGATTETHRVLEEEAARGGLDLRVVDRPVAGGPGAARNSGWRSARSALVAFTDDDCRPTPGWLAAGAAASGGDAIVQGPTQPDPADRLQLGLFSRTVEVSSLGPQFETCNIFYPRAILESMAGFDEAYGHGGEDTDLAWRSLEAGHSVAFEPQALVLHAVENLGPLGLLRVATRWSSAVRSLARHPETRTALYRGMFWNVWHYLVWRSLLALAGPAWLRRMLLTSHLMALRRRARSAGAGVSGVPFLLVHDVVECWAVARGAVRYRTFVL